jgi:hypothetical protein
MKYINCIVIALVLALLDLNTGVVFVGSLAYLFTLDHMQEEHRDLYNYVVLGSALLVLIPLIFIELR